MNLQINSFFLFKKNFFNAFIYFWRRERDRAWAGEGQREGETQNLKQAQALSCQHRARHGARTHRPRDRDLSRSRILNRLSHPGTPEWLLFFNLTSAGEIRKIFLGVPGWLSRLSFRLRLRSWSHGLWVRAPCRALCWQLKAWSLLQIPLFRFPSLSAPPPLVLSLSLSLSLCLSKINKH